MKCLALFFLFSGLAFSQSGPQDSALTQLIEEARAKYHNSGLALAAFRGDTILHMSFHGHADIEAGQQIDDRTLFMIGSTTKAMTATAAGYLVQQNALEWDTRVKDVLPNFELMDPVATQQATLRDLLLHRVGLPRHDLIWYSRNTDGDELFDLLPLLEFSAPFREKWQYNNLMYMVAGKMVSQSSGLSWGSAIENFLFEPLMMDDSRALFQDLREGDNLAQPYFWDGTRLAKSEQPNFDSISPAGSVLSSLRDMIKWVRFNMMACDPAQRDTADCQMLQAVQSPQMDIEYRPPFPEWGETNFHYALGWVVNEYRGHLNVQHNGRVDSYRTDLMFLPEQNLGVVALSNGGDFPPNVASLTALDHFLEVDRVDWAERFKPKDVIPPFPAVSFPDSYQKVEGFYSHPAYGQLVVEERERDEGRYLHVQINDNSTLYVNPWLTDDQRRWTYDYQGFTLHIVFDEAGDVEAIQANFEPQVSLIEFERVAPEL